MASHGCTGKEHIDLCHPCLTVKAKQPRTPLENIVATHPLELVHLDYLCLEPGKRKEENIQVVTDHLQTALMAAKPLWDNFIVHYGFTQEDPLQQGEELWKWTDCWPLYAYGDTETVN